MNLVAQGTNMRDANPYQPPDCHARNTANAKPRSTERWAMIGFVLGATLPNGFGAYGIHQHSIYVASLAPGEAACGMGALGSLAMIFVIGPFCGMIGAASSWAAAAIDW